MTASVLKEVLREVRTELIIGGEHRAASDGATFEVTIEGLLAFTETKYIAVSW